MPPWDRPLTGPDGSMSTEWRQFLQSLILRVIAAEAAVADHETRIATLEP